MTRIALGTLVLLALTFGCSRTGAVVLLPKCTPPAGEFARTFRPAASPDPALARRDSGSILIRIARGDSGHTEIQTIPRASALPAEIPLLVRRLDSGTFLARAPAGSAEVVVTGLGYEAYRDTLAVRRGFIDTVSYRLKPSCFYLH